MSIAVTLCARLHKTRHAPRAQRRASKGENRRSDVAASLANVAQACGICSRSFAQTASSASCNMLWRRVYDLNGIL